MRKERLLQVMLHQKRTKTPDCITIRHLIARINATELRKGAAVDLFILRAHIGQIVQVLQHMYPQHGFERIGLVAAFSLVVKRLDYRHPL